MNISDLISNQHRTRKAIIYVRQSTPQQVISNQESLAMQRALKERAHELGWANDDIEVIEDDLGLTATSAEHREGFKRMVTQVTLGKVGLILCFDVSRLIRNCSDLYPVLDICGYKGCLIADRDGIYDPASINGRLLLGLKGQLAEIELSTIRARLHAGILNKAKRGEFALRLPAGFIREEDGSVSKDPNLEVQARINLVFEMFFKLRSAAKVVRFFTLNNLLLPRRSYDGEVGWKKPCVTTILSVLKNPTYAGAYVFGKKETVRRGSSAADTIRRTLPMERWKIVIHNKYDSYVSWENFEKIQSMLKDNYAEYDKNKTRGIPRDGVALLHGIVYCGECGHKMIVIYKPRSRYMCNHMRRHYAEKICQYIATEPVDHYVVNAFFEALSDIEINAYQKAISSQRTNDQKATHALKQQLERLRYQAQLAERQFNRSDPDNRLVTGELERRWEEALRQLKNAEEEFKQKITVVQLPSITPELKNALSDLGKNLPAVWNSSKITHQQKKAFLRCLIEKVVIHRLSTDQLQLRIIWKGNQITTTKIMMVVGALTDLPNAEELEKRLLELVQANLSDTEIAQQLTHDGFHSPSNKNLLPSTVEILRRKLGFLKSPSRNYSKAPAGYLTLVQVAKKLALHRNWIYYNIANGHIKINRNPITNTYLFPDSNNTFNKLNSLRNKDSTCISFIDSDLGHSKRRASR